MSTVLPGRTRSRGVPPVGWTGRSGLATHGPPWSNSPTQADDTCEADTVIVDSDRRYSFPVGSEHLWATLTRVDDYQRWWPWLEEFTPGALEPGARWSCAVRPPLPYTVRFDLVVGDVVVGEHVRAAVEGDLTGVARLDIAETTAGSELRLRSSLAPAHPVLRTIARAARPIATFGHDWVLDTGFRQFTARAIDVPDPCGQPAER